MARDKPVAAVRTKKTFSEKFDDEFRFFRGWIAGPKSVGSIIPTSSVMARRMATVVDIRSALPVLEVGPGTGVITRAILGAGTRPENLYAVEYSPDFARHLRRAYPGVNILQGDALDLDTALGAASSLTFDSVVSSLPLLNFPLAQRIAYIEDLLARIPAGRPVVQFSYGFRAPVPDGRGNYRVEHLDFIMRNIPPAHVWIYRRGPAS